MRSLSRIKAIQAVEATARHGSYVTAAEELNVTPAAVGQQVRLLEAWVDTVLFRRAAQGSQRLTPTPALQEALREFSTGLDRLDAGVRRLRERTNRKVVAVTASQALVAKWLLPRLEQFTSAHADIDVRLDVTDRPLDLSQGDADIALRCGPGRWAGHTARLLMSEEIFPVASPSLFKPGAMPRSPAGLLKYTLIHDVALRPAKVFPDWQQWLHAQGLQEVPPPTSLEINASAAVIQAVINGQGIALARAALVGDDIAAGRLIRLCPQVHWPLEWAYYVLTAQDQALSPPVRLFHDWLLSLTLQRKVNRRPKKRTTAS
jgi:LysR family transcriptional regulator, glycine cleavage system transcriptional activator